MKTETTEFFKITRNQTPKREPVNARTAWENKAYSGRVQRDKKSLREGFKLL